MCIIDVDGTEIIIPDEIYLDSNNVRRTMRFIVAEQKNYIAERKRKAAERKKNR